jgi:hypothetical protein
VVIGMEAPRPVLYNLRKEALEIAALDAHYGQPPYNIASHIRDGLEDYYDGMWGYSGNSYFIYAWWLSGEPDKRG